MTVETGGATDRLVRLKMSSFIPEDFYHETDEKEEPGLAAPRFLDADQLMRLTSQQR